MVSRWDLVFWCFLLYHPPRILSVPCHFCTSGGINPLVNADMTELPGTMLPLCVCPQLAVQPVQDPLWLSKPEPPVGNTRKTYVDRWKVWMEELETWVSVLASLQTGWSTLNLTPLSYIQNVSTGVLNSLEKLNRAMLMLTRQCSHPATKRNFRSHTLRLVQRKHRRSLDPKCSFPGFFSQR